MPHKGQSPQNIPVSELQPSSGRDLGRADFISEHWLSISSLGLLAALLYVVFQKAFQHGRQVAWSRFSKELASMRESNDQLRSALEGAQLVPNGSVLVSYRQEGESLHSLPDGYVMRIERRLEHRAVAERLLRRELKPNEVVHHIYAPAKNDNSPKNLCVLDRDQHDIFHTYLEREVRLKGRYPKIADQKISLAKNFGGILLENPNAKTPGDEFEDI